MFLLVSFQYAVLLFMFVVALRDLRLFLLVLGDEDNISSAAPGHTANLDGSTRDVIIITASSASWLLMILFGDLLVLWRAWQLSVHNSTAKRILIVPGVALLSYIGTIPVVLLCQSRTPPSIISFSGSCGRKGLVNWCLSLLSNLTSTCVIAYIGWNHRTAMRTLFSSMGRRSVAEKILRLLAESGFIYFLVNMIVIVTAISQESTPETYSVSHPALYSFLLLWHPVFVPMATHIVVLLYGSLWDKMAEHSQPSASNRVTRSIQFARVPRRISSETSLASAEIAPQDIGAVSKEETLNRNVHQ
ncbi:hypothetical protein BDZ89DRAFT_1079623 [Hymenopellis radicata]|nr:hypothetical protein BDZ89DRAFT_1079623 [Hymenopellis radicata]